MEHNSIIGSMPWVVAAATAGWFGFMANKARKSTALWAVGGGLLGLVASTLIMGLGQATFIPFCSEQVLPFRLKIAALAILFVAVAGWLFTSSLHRHAAALNQPPSPASPPPPASPKPPAPPVKP
jgi:hypothetical protein